MAVQGGLFCEAAPAAAESAKPAARMVRCGECSRHRSARSVRDEPVPGWVQCGLARDPEGRARYLSPTYPRICDDWRA